MRREARCRRVDELRVLERVASRRRDAEELVVDPDVPDDHRGLAVDGDLQRRVAEHVGEPIDGELVIFGAGGDVNVSGERFPESFAGGQEHERTGENGERTSFHVRGC